MGTGLGLWVSRGIVLKHEGSMRLRSSTRPGASGTVVNIFLPSVVPRATDSERKTISANR
jgi:signal transduction histidine kinase